MFLLVCVSVNVTDFKLKPQCGHMILQHFVRLCMTSFLRFLPIDFMFFLYFIFLVPLQKHRLFFFLDILDFFFWVDFLFVLFCFFPGFFLLVA